MRVTRMRCSHSRIFAAIRTTCSGVLPAPKMTSGKPFRNARWVSTCAKPRSAIGADWKARSSLSRLILPARNFSNNWMASVAVTGRGCPGFRQLTSQISAVVVVMMAEETMAIGEQIPDHEDVDDHHDEDGPRKP